VVDAGLPAGATGLFTTRLGGVSTSSWAELNLSEQVGDEPPHVRTNRDLLARHLAASGVVYPRQVHGSSAGVVRREHLAEDAAAIADGPGVDSLVTCHAGLPIAVLAADCLPVLIADVVGGVVGAAHAGRRGLIAGVLQAAVAAMTAAGARPSDCVAVVGPGVCGRCYEVPEAMRDEVAAVLAVTAAATRTGAPALDLPAGAAYVLAASGVGQVRQIGICTVEDERFFSYRRDGVTGRFAGVVMLDDDD
jgi:polyphenol oxidase